MFKFGIDFLDTQIGEVSPGLVILHETVGAGGREFAITSLMNNTSSDYSLEYLAIVKTRDEIERELKLTFPNADVSELLNTVNIHSLARYYFKDSIVPLHWIESSALLDVLKGEKNVLAKLVEVFENLENSLVVLDSLTDLARVAKRIGWENLVDLLQGLRSLCLKKNILLMVLLTSGVLEKSKEEELLDQVDAVIVFELVVEKDSITRWMYFRKFLGVLPRLESERIVKYSIKIDPAVGFTISRVLRVL